MLNKAMKKCLLAAVCICLVFAANGFAQQDVASEASRLELQGQFKQAATLLSTAQRDKSLSVAERNRLAFELDRLDRIKQDYPLTREVLFTDLKDSVKGLTAEEYVQWIKGGRFDYRDIDGTRFFMGDSVRNLYRRRRPGPGAPGEHPRDQTGIRCREDALRSAQALSRHHERCGGSQCRPGR
jgi:hypothetical protein